MAAMNKRKRESQDIAGARPAPSMNMGNEFEQHYLQTEDDTMDFAAALSQHGANPTDGNSAQVSGQGVAQAGAGQSASDTAAAAMAQYHTMTVPQSTEQSFMTQTGEGVDLTGTTAGHRTSSFDDFNVSAVQSSPNGNSPPASSTNPKPAVGSEEWHKVRKDNHKEVERRRRETINEGINELAKIVPGCEKNKGSVLARSVQFIKQLKDNETQNIEKWTLEKLLTEQAIAELSSSCDKLKAECQRAWAECEQWKKAAQKAGITIDEKNEDDDDDAE